MQRGKKDREPSTRFCHLCPMLERCSSVLLLEGETPSDRAVGLGGSVVGLVAEAAAAAAAPF